MQTIFENLHIYVKNGRFLNSIYLFLKFSPPEDAVSVFSFTVQYTLCNNVYSSLRNCISNIILLYRIFFFCSWWNKTKKSSRISNKNFVDFQNCQKFNENRIFHSLRFGDCYVKNIICIALEKKFAYGLCLYLKKGI